MDTSSLGGFRVQPISTNKFRLLKNVLQLEPFPCSGILIASSVVPIALSILWARATAAGMISGIVGGCACGITSWLSYASTFEGGLSAETFVKNTGEVSQ